MRPRYVSLAVVAAFALFPPGCTTLGYYWQSVDGQMQILQARRSIANIIDNPNTPPELKQKLVRVLEIRDFASRELKLPENLSYRAYADLHREFVVWNVFATEEFSVEPEQWCFIIAGCVGYRGYFARADADKFAQEQRSLGRDVYVAGVPAYSTLGWFNDPVLNTVIKYPDYELARLIFHELAHQTAYASNDSQFNESFAITVELEGVRRWLAAQGDDEMCSAFERSQQHREQFTALVLKYRDQLRDLYASGLEPAVMLQRKALTFAALQQEYRQLRADWNGFGGYDRFFVTLNNANLASVAIYHALVPKFQQMLAEDHGDLGLFYAQVKRLASLSKKERDRVWAQSTRTLKFNRDLSQAHA